MKKGKIALGLALSIVMLGSVFTGCANQSGSSSSDETSGSQSSATGNTEEEVTLRFSWWGSDDRHEATLAVIDAFMEEHPNIKIAPEYSSQDGYNDKKTT